ncbi:DUF2972 domain-containing protein, partial [Helicobacter pullorum]|uniref:DUF2972 domain-containing protein n=1 Tax=Helicobacter pullorum TaxID=35818 RepID=UPI000816AC5C
GGILSLIISLYKIKKSHTKNHKIYQQTIQIFPQLKYPKLDACKDYNESLKYKLHLSYLLGNALIEADKNWYKGGYLKLLSKIEKAKARHRAIQEVVRIIPKEKQEIFYCIELENRVQINCEKINRIFQAHKDYQPIIDNILHNFSYFLENFSEIESWLLSGEFHKRYKKEKHPYPSLINPKTADYKNISAQLAWEMNLPLPENYDFLFLLIHGAGTTSMSYYLTAFCGVSLNRRFGDPYSQYCDSYKILLEDSKNKKGVILAGEFTTKNIADKFYAMITKKCPALCVVRDPISTLKPIVNHLTHWNVQKHGAIIREIDFSLDIDKLVEFKLPFLYSDNTGYPSLNAINFYDRVKNFNILQYRILALGERLSWIYYVDMAEILPCKTYNTLIKLADRFGFCPPKNSKIFEIILNNSSRHRARYFFPKNYRVSVGGKNIALHLRIENGVSNDKFVNCISEFTSSEFLLGEQVGATAYILAEDLEKLKADDEAWRKTRDYLKELFYRLDQCCTRDMQKLIDEDKILEFFREESNREVLIKHKAKFDEDLEHIKRYRPDIVESWKYYQEFLKICEEKGI